MGEYVWGCECRLYRMSVDECVALLLSKVDYRPTAEIDINY